MCVSIVLFGCYCFRGKLMLSLNYLRKSRCRWVQVCVRPSMEAFLLKISIGSIATRHILAKSTSHVVWPNAHRSIIALLRARDYETFSTTKHIERTSYGAECLCLYAHRLISTNSLSTLLPCVHSVRDGIHYIVNAYICAICTLWGIKKFSKNRKTTRPTENVQDNFLIY